MSSRQKREAFDYAERICSRLPRRLLGAREAVRKSRYGLEQQTGVSRDMIGDIERAFSIPTLHLAARMAHGLGITLWEFVRELED